jgi:Arc/MetJ-type ribon-helix-helix transcriptional regulator
MPTIEVSLPDKIESDIESLVEQGEYLNRERAIEDLLSRGISAYNTTTESSDEGFEETFTEGFDEQQDPAMRDEQSDDGYQF